MGIELKQNLFKIDDIEKGNRSFARQSKPSRIAVIGACGRFGGLQSLDEFWSLLENGESNMLPFPKARLDELHFVWRAELDKRSILPAGYFSDIDKFDHEFFNLSLKESRTIDPAQRIMLETIWGALDDAGYSGEGIKKTSTGVFLGYSCDHKEDYISYLRRLPGISNDEISLAGNVNSVLASRISYFLDLRGPSLVVDTACSSALVAVHLACQSLKNGECKMAIAGGINVDILPVVSGIDDTVGIRSPHNRIRAFDNKADGIASGEGTGAILLKPLELAVADGDNIYAVIAGSGVTQDGSGVGLTAPNPRAQSEAIISAWKSAGINPDTVSYIEAHGTGTKLGDPIEIEGLKRAFGVYTSQKGFCAIGSVKTNLGHLDSAAGIAGLIKLALMLKQRKIPASLGFTRPNRAIDFVNSPLYVADRTVDWIAPGGSPLRCGINSFGLSGTNCHVVLEEYTNRKQARYGDDDIALFTLSAQDSDSLREAASQTSAALRGRLAGESLVDICRTSNAGRSHYKYRLAIVAHSTEDLSDKLHKFCCGKWGQADDIYHAGHKMAPDDRESLRDGEIKLSDVRRKDAEAEDCVRGLDSAAGISEKKEINQKLARLYIDGGTPKWHELPLKYRKISLPGYCFKKTKCWPAADGAMIDSKNAKAFPLLSGAPFATYGETIFVSHYSKDNWVIGEHVVGGRYVLPGTAYIETLAEIMKLQGEFSAGFTIQKMVFVNQFSVGEDNTKALHFILRKDDKGYSFSVTSEDEEGGWVLHAEGKIISTTNGRLQAIDKSDLNISEYNEITELPDNRLVTIGFHWTGVSKKVYQKGARFISRMSFADRNYQHSFLFEPAIMDRSVNAVIDYLNEQVYYLPFSYDTLTLLRPLPAEFISLVEVKELKGEEIALLQVTLCSEDGTVFAHADNYAVKRASLAPPSVEGKISRISVEWKPRPIPKSTGQKTDGVILLMGKSDCIRRTATILSSLCKIIILPLDEPGADTARLCDEVIKAIQDDGILSLVYAADDAFDGVSAIGEIETAKDVTFDFIFLLTKAIASAKITKRINIAVFLRGAHTVLPDDILINPFYTALAAMCRVISLEYANIKTKVIDTDEIQNARVIIAELSGDMQNELCAYRNGIRYIRELIPQRESVVGKNYSFSENGVYLITGGTGALGLECAKYLSQIANINLALIGKSAIPGMDELGAKSDRASVTRADTIARAILDVESNGSKAELICCDVGDYNSLDKALSGLRQKYGRINGVIHCAGLAGRGLIVNEPKDVFDSVIRPKVEGTVFIDLLTREDKPDFMVYFSSINALAGSIAQSDYALANAFMDGYSWYRNAKGLKTLSINWPGWLDVGMAKEHQAFNKNDLLHGIHTEDALRWMLIALSSDVAQTVIGAFNKKKLLQPEQAKIPATPTAGQQSIVKRLAKIWANVLEIEEVDTFESFSNMGGDSIMATYLYKAVDREFPGAIDITDVFSYPSVDAMSKLIESHMKLTAAKVSIAEQAAVKNSISQGDAGDEMDYYLKQLAEGKITLGEAEKIFS